MTPPDPKALRHAGQAGAMTATYYNPWENPAHEAMLRKLWAEGCSASQISTALQAAYPDANYSRNAVIGKAHRLGLTGRASRTRQPPSKPGLAPKRTAPKPAASGTFSFFTGQAAPKLKLAGNGTVFVEPEPRAPFLGVKAGAFDPLVGSTPRPFEERGAEQCTWPVGPGGSGSLSCCQPVLQRGWCKSHYKRGTTSEATRRWVDRKLALPLREGFA